MNLRFLDNLSKLKYTSEQCSTHKMSSTILYKFRSGTTFEALPLPGSAARLFDVKKAIVTAKKLDQGSMEFDLSVRDATTNEEYVDESRLLPRGTRIVVQRLPAAKGHGFLARMARNQAGVPPYASGAPTQAAPNNFYTIDSRAQEEDEEFVSSAANDEDKELAALRAATDVATSATAIRGIRPAQPGGFRPPAGSGPPPSQQQGQHLRPNATFQPRQRPNADPELREHEKVAQPKKRATGIPRTFLNLSAPPATDGGQEGESSTPLLQPNTLGFKELVDRGGGQSESTSGTKKDLDYALKITATEIPDYLKCAICDGVVRDAMILPWDPEGRTTCEICIRDALTQNGFRCPLTGMEGVSPDDLLPNHALRKAAEQFIKGVMAKMEEIDKQQVEDDVVDETSGDQNGDAKNVLEGDSGEKGVLLSKRATIAAQKKKDEEDPFGGDDVFGGDVFAVEADVPEEMEEEKPDETEVKKDTEVKDGEKEEEPASEPTQKEAEPSTKQEEQKDAAKSTQADKQTERLDKRSDHSSDHQHRSVSPREDRDAHSRRETGRRRGPPVGYAMGPAGGAVDGPSPRAAGPPHRSGAFDEGHNGRGGGHGRGGRYGGRGDRPGGHFGRGHGEGGGRNDGPPHDHVSSFVDPSVALSFFVVSKLPFVLYCFCWFAFDGQSTRTLSKTCNREMVVNLNSIGRHASLVVCLLLKANVFSCF